MRTFSIIHFHSPDPTGFQDEGDDAGVWSFDVVTLSGNVSGFAAVEAVDFGTGDTVTSDLPNESSTPSTSTQPTEITEFETGDTIVGDPGPATRDAKS